MASSLKVGKEAMICSFECKSIERYPLNSCARVSGVASCKCVRPILIIPSNSFTFFSKVAISSSSAGISFFSTCSTATILIAVGKVSFEL